MIVASVWCQQGEQYRHITYRHSQMTWIPWNNRKDPIADKGKYLSEKFCALVNLL